MTLFEESWSDGKVRECDTRRVSRLQNNGKMCSRAMKCFDVTVGLHQGSALSLFLFAIVTNRLTNKIRGVSMDHDDYR